MNDFRQYDLSHWLEHIQTQHWRSIDLTLDRIDQVWRNLTGQRSDLVITIAGTNGKGSCVAMLEAVLLDAGLRVGSYTSPHLVRYNERIRINGHAVSDVTLCNAFQQIEYARNGIPLTYFEFGTLCALVIFQQQQVEAAILEVGMGGRLDAVNLIENDIALITSIGIDHAQWLGNSRETIAAEKAGVLKKNALAVSADSQPPQIIARIAADQRCTILQNEVDYRTELQGNSIVWTSRHPAIPAGWQTIPGLKQPISGSQQMNNLGGVIAVLALTCKRTGVTRINLVNGLANTRLTARCQVIGSSPEIILDVAHNRDSAIELAAFLRQRQVNGKTLAVMGALADKPVSEIFAGLDGEIDHWYLATLTGERGQTAENLKNQLIGLGCTSPVAIGDTPVSAYLAAMADAGVHDRLVIFGSFYTVGDIIGHLENEGGWAEDSAI